MDKPPAPQPGGAGAPMRIRNTFAPNCRNEYFTPEMLFALMRQGFQLRDMPEEAREMARECSEQYEASCTRPGEKIKIHALDLGPGGVVLGDRRGGDGPHGLTAADQ